MTILNMVLPEAQQWWNWDISKATTPTTFNLSSPIQYGYSIQFSPDGTKFYIAWYKWVGTWIIQQYSCSTAWDITTASNTYNIDFGTANNSFWNYPVMLLANEWQYLYFQDNPYSSQNLRLYSLATAWDINSNKTQIASYSWMYHPMRISDDGKAYIWNNESDFYYSTNSTAWSINTTWTNIASGSRWWAKFSSDGNYLYILISNRQITKYLLDTPRDPTSKTQVQQVTLPSWWDGLYFDDEWNNLYTVHWTTVYQYSLL